MTNDHSASCTAEHVKLSGVYSEVQIVSETVGEFKPESETEQKSPTISNK
jgi:hypothetical protein